MKWTVTKKMILIGVISVIGLGIMAANNFLTTRSVGHYAEVEAEKNDEINTINTSLQAHLTLMLNAMDAIIDKDEGQIEKERMDTINSSIALLKKNLKHLMDYSSTGNEKVMIQDVNSVFDKLAKGIQVELVNLIRESGARIKQIQTDFVAMDDVLDDYGDGFQEKLESILERLEKERKISASAQKESYLSSSVKIHLIQVQQWLTDISATRAAPGFDDGFAEAELHAKELKNDLNSLRSIAPNLKTQLDKLEVSFDAFFEKGKWMANQYIKYGPAQGNKAMGEFDAFASDIGEKLQNLIDLTSNRAVGLISLNAAVSHLEQMLKAHISLMLAAMDSIIDKDEGKINDERAREINISIDYIKNAIAGLNQYDSLGITSQEIDTLTADFSNLADGIQVKLKNLIEKSAAEALSISEAFVKIDDVLDEYGDKVEEDLVKIQSMVQKEVEEAKNATQRTLSRSKWMGMTTSVIILGSLMAALFFIARSIVGPITRISRELGEGAGQVANAAEQVSSSSQSLAEGSSSQAASIEETSSSMEEMSSMTRKNSENAGQADNLMVEANQVVSSANKSMEDLTQSMEEITKASEETSKIIKTIDEIAFQTNLLALNAAVEAARAGEAGAGFAVVADEVRNLAMRAAEAAKDTAELIEGTVQKVNTGSELVSTTSEAFSRVADSSSKVGSLVAEIAQASKEQSSGIEQVNNAITSMDKIVQQNAANAEESASASEEMNAQSRTLKESVAQLVQMVTDDKDLEVHDVSGSSRIKPVADSRFMQKQAVPNTKQKVIESKEISAEQVIPFDDDEEEFKDF